MGLLDFLYQAHAVLSRATERDVVALENRVKDQIEGTNKTIEQNISIQELVSAEIEVQTENVSKTTIASGLRELDQLLRMGAKRNDSIE